MTAYAEDQGAPTPDELRSGWRANDPRTVVLLADPGAPNMLRAYPGAAVLDKLPRAFFVELQARYGNLFVRREAGGEPAALAAALDALVGCLEAEAGCAVVPGLPPDKRGGWGQWGGGVQAADPDRPTPP